MITFCVVLRHYLEEMVFTFFENWNCIFIGIQWQDVNIHLEISKYLLVAVPL
jgi:hypothetical protein